MATVRQCLAQIARHNRCVAIQALYSDLAGLGIINMPNLTLPSFYSHISKDTKHLERWTHSRRPRRPTEVFGKEILNMEKTKLLKEFDGWHFIIDARSEKGPVRIVGEILDGGELKPHGIYGEDWAAANWGEKSINITRVISDPKNWD